MACHKMPPSNTESSFAVRGIYSQTASPGLSCKGTAPLNRKIAESQDLLKIQRYQDQSLALCASVCFAV